MSTGEALAYGLVQGLTEYLPISSSAHLVLLPKFLGASDPGLAFDVFCHIGTLLATLVYFRRDWMQIFKRKGEISWVALGLGVAPAALAGIVVHKLAEGVLRGVSVLIVSLLAGGVILWLADRNSPNSRELKSLKPLHALWVGLAQCLALVPGISRSGITIAAARFQGFSRQAAARFSFLISAPITAGAILFEGKKMLSGGMGEAGEIQLLFALGASFVSGWFAIDLLIRLLRHMSYFYFLVYRIGLIAAIVAFL